MKTIVALVTVLFSMSAFAIYGTLQSSTIEGANKYCKYSNGVIITIKSYKLCPISNG